MAVNIATKLNASHFVIESDSKICIDSIKAHVHQVSWRLLSFVLTINSISVTLGSVSFIWVYCEANLVAHELAKWSRSHSYFRSFGHDHCLPSVVDSYDFKGGLPFCVVFFSSIKSFIHPKNNNNNDIEA